MDYAKIAKEFEDRKRMGEEPEPVDDLDFDRGEDGIGNDELLPKQGQQGQDEGQSYNITQHKDGGCTSGSWQWRTMVPVTIMDKVFDLHYAAFMDIPFPKPMFTPECFYHPIWGLLNKDQRERANSYGMSFDPMGCNYDNDHCEFFETELDKLKTPHYCSFYVETGLDPFKNPDGIDLERSYDDSPPHRFVKFNIYDITSLIKLFLDPDEKGSVIVYEDNSPGTIQYDIVNFVYDMDRVLTDSQLDLANAVLDSVHIGEYPEAITDIPREEAFRAMATAMVADDSGMISWDTGLYLMQYICDSMHERLWLAKKLCRRIFGSDNDTVQFEREENYDWFVRKTMN